MSAGQIGILNVGAGDTKISFDKDNPAERIRAARIVKDMLRRGYALLVRVESPSGNGGYQRVFDFNEATCEYIIADFDPTVAAAADATEGKQQNEQAESSQRGEVEPAATASSAEAEAPRTEDRPSPRRSGRKTKAIAAESVHGVAVARTAGG